MSSRQASASAATADEESEIMEHEEKVSRYEAMFAQRLKTKYFSKKNFFGGEVFEDEITIENETIKSSRWPCTESFADPAKYLQERNHSQPLDSETSATPSKKPAPKKSS